MWCAMMRLSASMVSAVPNATLVLGEGSEEIEPVATIILGTVTQVAAALVRPGRDGLTSADSVIRLLVSILRVRTGDAPLAEAFGGNVAEVLGGGGEVGVGTPGEG